MELIINAARKSSFIPILENDAARGIVPYMHKGEASPKRLAEISLNRPDSFLSEAGQTVGGCFPFVKTEMTDPTTMSKIQ